ncbi:nitrogen fixation protein NifQ [Cupriavidus basilensis]|uniref:Nitrogen fixation protein NifQ n=1 Tax=Cupriavidus basilensis TaxID=68895 RepID=A0A7M2H6X7_9BURK|nr:nitrogen fixation protein NifQ [Cupriavidus basilensis]QOT80700.1 nitrogen fixation protein NifQ [Cupriavidus basilensis]
MNQSLLILDAFSLSPGEPACRALAGVLESANAARLPRFAQWLGLAEPEFWQMLDHCFPGARAAGWAPESAPVDAAALPCEFADLVQMLIASGDPARPARPETRWAAHALASGCFGGSHLWHDMGLSGRHDVSRLLQAYFPSLYAANTTDMKWKKFFYHALCQRLDLHPCPEPACAGCDNYASCHGTESVIGWR